VALGALERLDGVEDGLSTRPLFDATPFAEDSSRLRAFARREGYLFFRRCIEPGTLLALRHAVLEACARRDWLVPGTDPKAGTFRPGLALGAYDETWVKLQGDILPHPAFDAVRRHPAVLGVLERLFGEPAITGLGDTCRIFSAGAADLTTRPHQDAFYVGGHKELWTVWLPLDDCAVEKGGLAVLPGSHRRGLRVHCGEGSGRQGASVSPSRVWATAGYACGDALFFGGFTLHRACVNISDRPRLSADFRYRPASG